VLLPLPTQLPKTGAITYGDFFAQTAGASPCRLLPTIRGRESRSLEIAVRLAHLGTSPACAARTTSRILPPLFRCCANDPSLAGSFLLLLRLCDRSRQVAARRKRAGTDKTPGSVLVIGCAMGGTLRSICPCPYSKDTKVIRHESSRHSPCRPPLWRTAEATLCLLF
jgi:hypothetical protein